MPSKSKLMIVSPQAADYAALLQAENLPGLAISLADNPEAARRDIATADILMGSPAYLAEVLDEALQVRWVQSTAAGVNELCQPGLRRDYLLTNVRDVFGQLMSEYIFGYILALERSLIPFYQHQQQREWIDWHQYPYPYRSLPELTLGVLGLGSIGKQIAATGAFFGMRVLGMKRTPAPVAGVETVYGLEQLADFLPQVDYLVSVLPDTAETRHFIDAAFFRLMKPEAVFMNVGRGATVDERALLDALQTGQIKTAVLDVFEQEPLAKDSPLWAQPNVLITPHVSALSFPRPVCGIFAENYRRYRAGEPLQYVIDFERGY